MVDRPGIVVAPPLLFLLGWVVGAGVRWYTGMGKVAAFWLPLVGWPLIVAGVLLAIWGAWTLRRHHTGILPHRPTTTIVTNGPYRFSRNPLYLAMTLVYIGTALLLRNWWALVMLPGVLIALHPLAIFREEAYLTTKFGAIYSEYRDRVPRWI
jgi:protein-S-isoprenylcysteine O-methyltransferase Ste14